MSFLDKIKLKYIYLFLFILSMAAYLNSTSNEYAFDDDIVVLGNKPVLKGFAGIKEIFTTDMFASYIEDYKVEGNKLSGGRYRPLSIASFAIEQQFVGSDPGPKHWLNIILYSLLIVLIFHFLLNDMKQSVQVSFITAFLFALHPIHTEVVANLKSRDEILSLIFYLLTISSYLKYLDSKTTKKFVLLILCFIAALLSKEYAITLLVVLPVAAYTLRKHTVPASIKNISALLITFIAYALIRGSIVGWGAPEQMVPLNNAYVYATGTEKIATKIFVLLKYFILLFKPFPLSSDYSYAQISYRMFANPEVWLSLILHITLLVYTIKGVLQRKLFGFAGILYFTNLLLVSNLFFNIGASMGERFMFHSSLAFCMVLAVGAEKLNKRFSDRAHLIIPSALCMYLIVAFIIIIPRNRDWKNSHTLFLKDVETSPNSALCNANATVALVNMAIDPVNITKRDSLLKKAALYSKRATEIHPGFGNAYFNWAVCEFNLQHYDTALLLWDKGFSVFDSPQHKLIYAQLTYKQALKEGENKQFDNAIILLKWSVKIEPVIASRWSDLGGAYFSVNQLEEAKVCWEKALSLDPADPQANRALPFVNMKLSEAKGK